MRGRRWLTALILFGLTSLLADVCYEGFRAMLGPLASEKHGSWLALGLVMAEGEALNWGLRLPAALLADRLGAYWALTILGYSLVPVGVGLALAAPGLAALALGVGLERLGKTLRGPARDALLSGLGGPRGLVYGVHELMDQVGAVAGPLLAYAAIESGNQWLILAPGAAAVASIVAARLVYPGRVGGAERKAGSLRLHAGIFALGLTTLLLPHPVVAAAAAAAAAGNAAAAPLAYTLAMVVDGAAALPLGRLYDRVGAASLAVLPASGVAAALLLALGEPLWSMVAIGVGLAALETVYRAYVADRVPERAAGFGSLSLGVGVGQAASAVLYSVIASIVYPPLASLSTP